MKITRKRVPPKDLSIPIFIHWVLRLVFKNRSDGPTKGILMLDLSDLILDSGSPAVSLPLLSRKVPGDGRFLSI